mmetsp:Transcript_96814/g.252464  ORF Transcript_96814/g.252464 Transcript_96814/m.252464 type:complete len:274 (-) Transcript_96814:125-946(-)
MSYEYRSCLDVHSLGVTALRVLVELMPLLEGTSSDIAGAEAALPKLRALRAAWGRYWADARRFWQPVYNAFRGAGDFEALRSAYVSAGVHRVVAADLRALRAAMCEARLACLGLAPETGLAGMPAMLDALLLMLQDAREGDGCVPAKPQEADFEVSSQSLTLPVSEKEKHKMPPTRSSGVEEAKSRLSRWPSVSTASPESSPSSTWSSGPEGEDGSDSDTISSDGGSPRRRGVCLPVRQAPKEGPSPKCEAVHRSSRFSVAWSTAASRSGGRR